MAARRPSQQLHGSIFCPDVDLHFSGMVTCFHLFDPRKRCRIAHQWHHGYSVDPLFRQATQLDLPFRHSCRGGQLALVGSVAHVAGISPVWCPGRWTPDSRHGSGRSHWRHGLPPLAQRLHGPQRPVLRGQQFKHLAVKLSATVVP